MVESHPELHVCGEATNGKEAITLTERLCPDVITMDIEMPEMDGISAVREIMQRRPTPVLMFSSLTYDGAKATLEALEAGASDFIPKRFADISGDGAQIERQLCDRLLELGGGARGGGRRRGEAAAAAIKRPAKDKAEQDSPSPPRHKAQEAALPPEPRREAGDSAATDPVVSSRRRTAARGPRIADLEAIVIGCSTGGPVALQKVLTTLPANFPVPILAVQHMPASFTPAFAERLNELCRVKVREAKEGDVLRPGEVLLAPGGKHVGVRGRGGAMTVYTHEGASDNYYKPSVDIAFAEISRVAPGAILGIVLTGMGSDGAKGAKTLKDNGSWVWSQDEATSVIYGMPAAVAKAGLSDQVLPLDQIGLELSRLR